MGNYTRWPHELHQAAVGYNRSVSSRIARAFAPRPEFAEAARRRRFRYWFRSALLAIYPPLPITCTVSGVKVRGVNRAGHGVRALFVLGVDAEPEIALVLSQLAPGDYFLDIGARIGAYALPAARIVGQSGLVVAMEPDLQAASHMQFSARRNGLTNLVILSCGASDKTRVARLEAHGRPDARAVVASEASTLGQAIGLLTLDSLESLIPAGRLRAIKVDVEGHEMEVLRGARHLIARDHPLLVVESAISGNPTVPGYKFESLPRSRNLVGRPVCENGCSE